MFDEIKKIVDNGKFNKFYSIADQLYTQEYIGVDEYKNDPLYEQELTEIATIYLISIFYSPEQKEAVKSELLRVMKKKQPKTKSKILEIVL
jgi:hypothetical protein